MTHYSEDDLTLYYYGEGRRRAEIDKHLSDCRACASTYREIAGTLGMIVVPEAPERGDQYGLEVWQRIRHRLPDQDRSPWSAPRNVFARFRGERLGLLAAAAALLLAAFVAGRVWPGGATAPDVPRTSTAAAPTSGDVGHRILLTSVADHLDRSGRVLSDIMNAASAGDISTEQQWADDLLTTSRLYRQDAVDAGEESVATMLDELERNLLEIVHSPSTISQADLDQIRRRIDAAALLFKVRVMSDELRQREQPPAADARVPRTSTRKIS
jgi:hypothetical protein